MLEQLIKKMNPRQVAASAQLHYIISSILGQNWVTAPRASGGFTISSDGFVTSGGVFLGEAVEDFERPVLAYIQAAGLTPEEVAFFGERYSQVVLDYRTNPAGSPGRLPLPR